MQGPRRKVKLMVMMTMVFLFIVVEVSRNAGKSEGNKPKILVPTKRFWAKDLPKDAYWNRQQQQLNYINNHNLGQLNFTVEKVPDWLNDTADLTSCEPNYKMTTQVKDYDSLPSRFKDFLLYMRCRTYPIVVDQPDLCKEQPFLLLAIKSLVPHFDRRQAIRESWGRASRVANKTVVTVFLLGNAASEDHFPNLSPMLHHESSVHRDILQWDYRDTFFNLTIKEVLFLDWLTTRCPGAQYVFKGDDDVFVNTIRIIDFLSNLSLSRAKDLFIGDVITNAGPHRDKKVKYFIPESVFTGTYPAYAGGGGYLFSGQLAERLLNASRLVPLYPIDDVYTGMCLVKLGLAPEKHKAFRTFDIEEKYRENACAYRDLMLVHPRNPQNMIKIWTWLSDPSLSCP